MSLVARLFSASCRALHRWLHPPDLGTLGEEAHLFWSRTVVFPYFPLNIDLLACSRRPVKVCGAPRSREHLPAASAERQLSQLKASAVRSDRCALATYEQAISTLADILNAFDVFSHLHRVPRLAALVAPSYPIATDAASGKEP